ncbi:MAG: hypothetical protein KC416_13945 [Myxococcales bacterium]|nr:hypothetical protein [Myxococcales bacterium]
MIRRILAVGSVALVLVLAQGPWAGRASADALPSEDASSADSGPGRTVLGLSGLLVGGAVAGLSVYALTLEGECTQRAMGRCVQVDDSGGGLVVASWIGIGLGVGLAATGVLAWLGLFDGERTGRGVVPDIAVSSRSWSITLRTRF